MKKIKQEGPNGDNLLSELHVFLMELPIKFREATCIECNWSIPTFYRKMRTKDKVGTSALSNAEKEGILRKAHLAFEDFKVCLDKYR